MNVETTEIKQTHHSGARFNNLSTKVTSHAAQKAQSLVYGNLVGRQQGSRQTHESCEKHEVMHFTEEVYNREKEETEGVAASDGEEHDGSKSIPKAMVNRPKLFSDSPQCKSLYLKCRDKSWKRGSEATTVKQRSRERPNETLKYLRHTRRTVMKDSEELLLERW